MSFKEDFLEALRSVKKDLFNDSGAEETPSPVGYSLEKKDSTPADHTPDTPAETEEGLEISDDIDADEFDADELGSDKTDRRGEPEDDDYGSVEISANGVHTDAADSHEDGNPPAWFEPALPAAPPPRPYDYSPSAGDGMGGGKDGRQVFDFSADGVFDDEKTIISRNTVIRGALQTEDSVRLLGQVLGDIDCKSNIVVAGKVRGNTSAANAYVVDAQVDGNMVCEDSISVNDDAWILGNIRARQAEVDGKVKGNLEIRHNISIGSASSVIGNISTDELEIKRGAFINGQIIMYSPSRDVLDRFDRFEDGRQQP